MLTAANSSSALSIRAGDLVSAVRPSDTLLAVGSVVSGLGSSSAGLDLLLIGPGAANRSVAASVAAMRSNTYLLDSGESVRVRFYSDGELRAVATTVGHFDQAFYEPSLWANLPHLSIERQVLLHELRNGVVLANASIAQVWRERLHLDQLHQYLAAVHLLRFASRRRAALWQLKDGDHESAQWMTRECLEELLAALLASVGETNPRKRWHLKLVRKHEETLGAAVNQVLGLLCGWPQKRVPTAISAALEAADELTAGIIARCPELEMLTEVGVLDGSRTLQFTTESRV